MAKLKSEGLVQFIKFGIVGVLNTGVDWVVFYLLANSLLNDEKTIAKVISFMVAMLNSYLFNTIWTFKKEYKKATSGSAGVTKGAIFGKFAVVSLVGWGVNVLVFNRASLIDYSLLGNKDLLALVLASGAAIVWNFFANKLWTYKK
jgi:putative flippase GtrA